MGTGGEAAEGSQGRSTPTVCAVCASLPSQNEIICVKLRRGEHRLDIGSFLSYYQAFIEFGLANPERGAALRGRLRTRLRQRSR